MIFALLLWSETKPTVSPRYACTCPLENHWAKLIPKLKIHENSGSFYCFANAEENYIHKWAEQCIQEGVNYPGFLEKYKGDQKDYVEVKSGMSCYSAMAGNTHCCHRKDEMVVLLGLNPWERCASFKGKKQKDSRRAEVLWASCSMKPERKICMSTIPLWQCTRRLRWKHTYLPPEHLLAVVHGTTF